MAEHTYGLLDARPRCIDIEVVVRPEVQHLLVSGGVEAQMLSIRLLAVINHPMIADQLPPSSELCLTLLSDKEIHELNRDYRKKDRPTDVLSFALLEGEQLQVPSEVAVPLGDIMISVETALSQVKRGVLPRLSSALSTDTIWGLGEELSFLSLHGFLHVLGYDHEEDREAEMMEKLELELLPTLLAGKIAQKEELSR